MSFPKLGVEHYGRSWVRCEPRIHFVVLAVSVTSAAGEGMCAPGSKAWTRALDSMRCLLLIAAAVACMARFLVDNFVAYEVAYVVNSEIAYMLTGTIPDYAPSKLHFSQDALDEIDNLQGYVWVRERIYPT